MATPGAKIKVRTPTGKEVKVGLYDYRSWWLYDRETINNGDTSVYFFQSPEGKSISDTNLKQFSTIQFGWTLEVHAIRIIPQPSIGRSDLINLFNNMAVTLIREGTEAVFSAPGLIFTAGAGIYGFTTDTSATIASNGLPTPDAVLKLPVPILIKGGDTFNIRVDWDPAVSLSGPVKVWMVLDGLLKKPVRGS